MQSNDFIRSISSSVVIPSLMTCLFLLSSSCGLYEKEAVDPVAEARENAPAGLVRDPLANDIVRVGLGNQVQLSELPDEEDIVWAPEDENIPIPGFESVAPSKVKKDDWEVSYSQAVKAARSRGKPILMWFTDSARSSHCKALGNELFKTKKFLSWAKENVVLLRLDIAISKDEPRRDAKVVYIQKLRKRYKVLGNPVVLLASPSGAVLEKIVGYSSGRSRSTMEKIEAGHHFAIQDYGKWREKMERKGYRMWVDLKQNQVFAKLIRYNEGEVWLLEADGSKGRTFESKLSAADQEWIESEKKKRL